MAPPKKNASKPTLVVALKVAPARLADIIGTKAIKEESPVKDAKESQDSPTTSATIPAPPASSGENASDSNPATPNAGTPAPAAMAPPAEKKKPGPKRSAPPATGPDGTVKVRGKPGPKKKPRLEDGTIDPNAPRPTGAAAHKLGPKANQGAINAGLRALDRSGKPCRKWQKGGFRLKTFTGVVWELSRWTAPPKPSPVASTDESADASGTSSTKENKEAVEKSEGNSNNSNNGGDVEMAMDASSPAPPIPVAAAS